MRRSSQRARAVRAAQILNPDLVVLDLAMPVMNGLDAARMLRRIMPAVPLIMYCGFGDKFVEQQARLIGIAALISKSRSSRHSGGQGASSAEPKISDSVKECSEYRAIHGAIVSSSDKSLFAQQYPAPEVSSLHQ